MQHESSTFFRSSGRIPKVPWYTSWYISFGACMWLHGESCCDARFLYKPCCSDGAQEVADPVRTRLRERLRGSRFALVGDSLTRQWFEILTCFLGLSVPTWFAIPPARVPMVAQIHHHPHGYSGKTAGYSIAGGSSTVEYFHFQTGNLSDVLHFCQASDFVVVNFGVHYHRPGWTDQSSIRSDILSAAQECKRSGTRCIFRETFPQHFPTQLGLYDANLSSKRVNCAPLHDPTHAFDVHNGPLHASNSSINILRTWAPMVSAWDKHSPGDCTHYCSSDSIWVKVHETLLAVL